MSLSTRNRNASSNVSLSKCPAKHKQVQIMRDGKRGESTDSNVNGSLNSFSFAFKLKPPLLKARSPHIVFWLSSVNVAMYHNDENHPVRNLFKITHAGSQNRPAVKRVLTQSMEFARRVPRRPKRNFLTNGLLLLLLWCINFLGLQRV